jgi:CRP/FNR family transcriptional regulator, cyclic AMP receptor protein
MPVPLENLRELPAFEQLEIRSCEILAQNMFAKTYAAGQFIFLEGDEANSLWFIQSGTVRILKQSQNGRQQGLCTVNKGKCFGTCPLFDQVKNPADAQALTEVSLYILPRTILQNLVYQNPELTRCLLGLYTERLKHLAKLGEALGTWTVGQRINDCLLAFAKDRANSVVVELSHEEIATVVGTAREVVSRHLAELEVQQLIQSKQRSITLLDIQALNTACLAQPRL